jgi:hypothetical protein
VGWEEKVIFHLSREGFLGLFFGKKDGRSVITYTLSNCQKRGIGSSFCNISTTNP